MQRRHTAATRLNAVAAHWILVTIEEEVIERARRPFPAEPIRTLDAMHIASALAARKAVPDLVMLSLDERVRKTAHHLGLLLSPSDTELGLRSNAP